MQRTFTAFFVVVIACAGAGCAPPTPSLADATLRLGLLDGPEESDRLVSFSYDLPSTPDACPVVDDDSARLGERALAYGSVGGRIDANLFHGASCAPIDGFSFFSADDDLSRIFTLQDGETIRSASAPSFSVLHEVRFVGDAEGGTVGKGDTVFVHVAHGSDVVSNIGVQVDRGFVATVSSGDGSDASFVAPDVAGAIEVFVNGDIAGIDDCDGFAACAFAGSFARVLRLNVTQ